MREFNGPKDWYKHVGGLVIRELNEVCLEKSGQVMRGTSGLWLKVKWPSNSRILGSIRIFISGQVIRELNEVCPDKNGQVMRQISVLWL